MGGIGGFGGFGDWGGNSGGQSMLHGRTTVSIHHGLNRVAQSNYVMIVKEGTGRSIIEW